MLQQLTEIEEQPYSEDDAEWDEFVTNHPHGSLLQLTNWARLKNRFGWRSHRVWLRKDQKLVAGAQMLVKSAALGMLRVAYVPHGPLVDWYDEEQVAVMFNQLDFAAYEKRAGLLKFEPLLWSSEQIGQDWDSFCRQHDCVPNSDTIQPPRTIVVDLLPPEEEILANMKQKTRYNIRLASKKRVSVRQGSLDDIDSFNRLIEETSQRNEFGVHDPDYYKTAFELFAPDNVAIFFAEFEGVPLSTVMVFASGKRGAYLYGASSEKERHRMPAYAAQWAGMMWAKQRGCEEYDLWGVPDYPLEELEAQFGGRQDGLWGVYRFKRGFGGEVRRTVGTADRVYNKMVNRLYHWRRNR